MAGRKCNKNFKELKFELLKFNGKYAAKCGICGSVIKNTAAARLQSHRNICKPKYNEYFTEKQSEMIFFADISENNNLKFAVTPQRIDIKPNFGEEERGDIAVNRYFFTQSGSHGTISDSDQYKVNIVHGPLISSANGNNPVSIFANTTEPSTSSNNDKSSIPTLVNTSLSSEKLNPLTTSNFLISDHFNFTESPKRFRLDVEKTEPPSTCQDGEKNDKETQQNDHNDSKTTQAQVYDTNSAFPESSVQFHVNETCENEVANSSDDDAAAQENVYPSVLLKQEQNSFELQTPVDSIYPEQRNTQALEQIAKQLKLRNKLKYFELFQTFEGFEDL